MTPQARAAATLGAACLGLAACASQPGHPAYMSWALINRIPAVFLGFFHGFLAPVTLLLSMVGDVRIYAWPNDGWPYDFGFVVGLTCFIQLVAVAFRR